MVLPEQKLYPHGLFGAPHRSGVPGGGVGRNEMAGACVLGRGVGVDGEGTGLEAAGVLSGVGGGVGRSEGGADVTTAEAVALGTVVVESPAGLASAVSGDPLDG